MKYLGRAKRVLTMSNMGEFIELHDIHNNNPILIRKNEIKSVYVYGKGGITTVIVGNREFDVVESYKQVRGMLVPPDAIEIKYSEEDKKRIEKSLEQMNMASTLLAFGNRGQEYWGDEYR